MYPVSAEGRKYLISVDTKPIFRGYAAVGVASKCDINVTREEFLLD